MISTRHSRLGFTLIELLISMTIGMIVLMLAISMLGRTRDDYERVGGGVSAEREARAVLTQLTSDLNNANPFPDCVFEKSAAAWPFDRLGFLSLQAPDAQSTKGRIGDLCAIQYYLKDLVIDGKTVRCLMRSFRESNDTFMALRENQSPTLFTPTERDEPVAFGILSFEARPKIRDTAGLWKDWEKTADKLSPAPEAIDVRLVIARRDLVGKLTNPGAWDGGGFAAKLLGQPSQAINNGHLVVYSTLIRFGNHAAL